MPHLPPTTLVKLTSSNRHTQLLAEHPAQFLAKVKSDQVKGTIQRLWNMPYPADPLLEPDFVGLTYGQAATLRQMQAAADGSGDAFERLIDRLIGKATQVSLNASVGVPYKDFLRSVAEAEGEIIRDADVIDADFRSGKSDADQIT